KCSTNDEGQTEIQKHRPPRDVKQVGGGVETHDFLPLGSNEVEGLPRSATDHSRSAPTLVRRTRQPHFANSAEPQRFYGSSTREPAHRDRQEARVFVAQTTGEVRTGRPATE